MSSAEVKVSQDGWKQFVDPRQSKILVCLLAIPVAIYFEFNHNNKFLAYILYPMMIMPIVMRRITYKIFFKYYRMT